MIRGPHVTEAGGQGPAGSAGPAGPPGPPGPAGPSYGTPFPVLPDDAYAYACEDAPGSASLANTGSGPTGALALVGAAGVSYVLGSRRLSKVRNAVRFLADAPGGGAISPATCVIAGGQITLEAYAAAEPQPAAVGMLLSADAGANDYAFIGTLAGGWYGGVKIGGTERNTSWPAAHPIRYCVGQHLQLTYNPAVSPSLRFYVDGVQVATDDALHAPLATLSRVSSGNLAPALVYPFRGVIMQARVATTARDAAYALARAENVFSL